MIAKLAIVEEEVDETLYWLELVDELGFVEKQSLVGLRESAESILRMVVASLRTLKNDQQTQNPKPKT